MMDELGRENMTTASRAADVTLTEWWNGGERQNKRWIKGVGERWRSWASSPLALLLFLPFKELHKLEEIMTALKQAQQIKHWSEGGEKVCEWVREAVGIGGRSEVIPNGAREAARGSKLSA